MSDTLQRPFWDGHPVPLGAAFEMLKSKNGRSLHAVCGLRSHQFGGELVLEVDRLLARSQVCRSTDEVLDVTERWRAAMLESGWMIAPYPSTSGHYRRGLPTNGMTRPAVRVRAILCLTTGVLFAVAASSRTRCSRRAGSDSSAGRAPAPSAP